MDLSLDHYFICLLSLKSVDYVSMALLHSEKIKLGTPAADFSLRGVDGQNYSLADFQNKKALVILFICSHCPYVQAVEERILQLHRDYASKGVQLIGICSNDSIEYPEDSAQNLKKRWKEKNYDFPYLVDETQDTARAYGAVCTPDIYVFDHDRKLVYHGRIDDNWQEPSQVTRRELAEALDQILNGSKPSEKQQPSMGCSIKWKK